MKVLIVENSEPMRRMIKSLLNDLVEEFVECVDGSEALAAYEQHQPDLVLMDLKMKSVDGIEVTRRITKAYPHARIIIVSQYNDATLWQAARNAGAESILSKSDLFPLRRILGEK
jgi:CheY-like chemotaxis protein